jgi:transcriptional regulator with XRE-family HTH domain
MSGTRPQHVAAYRRLCKLLRQWRLDADMTQRDLAKKLGRAHTIIHKCETGDRRIDPIELGKWASLCGVPPKALLEAMEYNPKIVGER